MKKLLTIGMIVLFSLTSCSIDWNNEKDAKINELEKQVQDDLFKKKQECAKYKNEIENDIKNRWDEKFVELFYSPIRHSCIYVTDRFFNDACQESHRQRMVYDHLNKYDWWIIWSDICACSKSEKTDCHENIMSVFSEIQKLKWE